MDVFYHVPPDTKMFGYIRYSRAKPKQVYDIAGETIGVADITMSERYVCLEHLFTVLAKVALDRKG